MQLDNRESGVWQYPGVRPGLRAIFAEYSRTNSFHCQLFASNSYRSFPKWLTILKHWQNIELPVHIHITIKELRQQNRDSMEKVNDSFQPIWKVYAFPKNLILQLNLIEMFWMCHSLSIFSRTLSYLSLSLSFFLFLLLSVCVHIYVCVPFGSCCIYVSGRAKDSEYIFYEPHTRMNSMT